MREDTAFFLSLAAMIASVLIACASQIMLKKAAEKSYARWIDQYLNPLVIFAYVLFVLSTLLSTFGLRRLPLSLSPVWSASGQLTVVLMAYLFLHERPGKRKLLGVGVIVAGIVLFSL